MKKLKYFSILILLITVAILPTTVSALPIGLNGEYLVDAQATQTGIDTWLFQYDITNINQTNLDPMTGLDGFTIQLPDTATIVNVTVPDPYSGSGYWGSYNAGTSPPAWASDPVLGTPTIGNSWYTWWGYEPSSVYPIGTTATFTIELSNVTLGANNSLLTTYWDFEGAANGEETWIRPIIGTEYTSFYVNILSPVSASVPEPATMLLLCIGLVGLAGSRIRRKKKA